MRYEYKIVARKSQRQRPLWGPKYRLEYNTKKDISETLWSCELDQTDLWWCAMTGFSENAGEPLDSITVGNFMTGWISLSMKEEPR